MTWHQRFAPFTILLAAGCGLFGPDSEEVLLPVSALATPASVSVGEPFEVTLENIVLIDGCHSFDRVDLNDSADTVELRAMGRRTLEGGCTDMVTYLDAVAVDVPIRLSAGQLVVVVIQPSGSNLTGYIDVR